MFTSSNYDILDNNLYMSASCLLRQNPQKTPSSDLKSLQTTRTNPMVFVAKQKPTHHPLNDPNLPEHLPKFQGHRSRASTKHRCIERDLKDRDESPSNLENESKIKKTPQSSAFSRHTHTHNGLGNLDDLHVSGSPKLNKPSRNSEALRLSLA